MTQSDGIPRLLTVADVAGILALKPQSIYQLVNRRAIGGIVKLSARALRFDPIRFQAWLKEKSCEPGSGAEPPQSPPKKKKNVGGNISRAKIDIDNLVARAKKEAEK